MGGYWAIIGIALSNQTFQGRPICQLGGGGGGGWGGGYGYFEKKKLTQIFQKKTNLPRYFQQKKTYLNINIKKKFTQVCQKKM